MFLFLLLLLFSGLCPEDQFPGELTLAGHKWGRANLSAVRKHMGLPYSFYDMLSKSFYFCSLGKLKLG